jgi:hypothetical protein
MSVPSPPGDERLHQEVNNRASAFGFKDSRLRLAKQGYLGLLLVKLGSKGGFSIQLMPQVFGRPRMLQGDAQLVRRQTSQEADDVRVLGRRRSLREGGVVGKRGDAVELVEHHSLHTGQGLGDAKYWTNPMRW